MPTPVVSEDLILRLGVGLTGATLLGGSALAADLAQAHMTALGTICGASTNPHCGWCLGAVGLALAGLTALGLATAPPRVKASEEIRR